MDIKNFINRRTTIDSDFRQNNLSVLITDYQPHMLSLVRNILFRLETTGRENELVFYKTVSNSEAITRFLDEFTGFFSTSIVVYEGDLDVLPLDNDTIVMINDLKTDNTDFQKLIYPQDKKILSISTYFSPDNKANIVLSNAKLNPILGTVYLDNQLMTNMLFRDIDETQYLLVESKIFNMFNTIVTDGLQIEQTKEQMMFDNIQSTFDYKFKDISRKEKFFSNETLDIDVDSELVSAELSPVKLLNITDRQTLTPEETNVLMKIVATYLNNIQRKLQGNLEEMNLLAYSQEFLERKEEINQENERLQQQSRNLQVVLNTIRQNNSRIIQNCSIDDLEVLSDIAETILAM